MNTSDTENLGKMVELWFVFSLIWSICASVDEDGRKKMDNFLREMEGSFPAKVLHRAQSLLTHARRKDARFTCLSVFASYSLV